MKVSNTNRTAVHYNTNGRKVRIAPSTQSYQVWAKEPFEKPVLLASYERESDAYLALLVTSKQALHQCLDRYSNVDDAIIITHHMSTPQGVFFLKDEDERVFQAFLERDAHKLRPCTTKNLEALIEDIANL